MSLYPYDEGLGIENFCGVDEAGRGPVAGDVYAGAVILSFRPEDQIEGLNDSKKISEKKRAALYEEIQKKAVAYAFGVATVEEIETLGIKEATFLAMYRAVDALLVKPKFALVDGNLNPRLPVPSRCLVKGDQTSASIAAASIVAKVERDRYMCRMAKLYPDYQFEKHKGYGTKDHRQFLEQYGVTPIHRLSFLKKWGYENTANQHGVLGEAAAKALFVDAGYQVVEKNYRCPYGEVDLIAENGEFLVFCEVKTRTEGSLSTPKEAVDQKKREKLTKTALIYISEHNVSLQPRFDVVEIVLTKAGTVKDSEWYENAF